MPLRRRDHRARKARDQRLAAVFGERHAVDLRQTAQHLDLKSADGKDIDNRHRDKAGDAGPNREAVDQLAAISAFLGRLTPAFRSRRLRRFRCHSGSFLVTPLAPATPSSRLQSNSALVRPDGLYRGCRCQALAIAVSLASLTVRTLRRALRSARPLCSFVCVPPPHRRKCRYTVFRHWLWLAKAIPARSASFVILPLWHYVMVP